MRNRHSGEKEEVDNREGRIKSHGGQVQTDRQIHRGVGRLSADFLQYKLLLTTNQKPFHLDLNSPSEAGELGLGSIPGCHPHMSSVLTQ